jgi:hypothetical protein
MFFTTRCSLQRTAASLFLLIRSGSVTIMVPYYYTVLRIRQVYPESRILIFYPSRIPNIGSRTQHELPYPTKEEGQKISSQFFL